MMLLTELEIDINSWVTLHLRPLAVTFRQT